MEYIWVKADERNIESKVQKKLNEGWELFDRPFRTKKIMNDNGLEVQFFAQVMTKGKKKTVKNNYMKKK